MKTILKIILC